MRCKFIGFIFIFLFSSSILLAQSSQYTTQSIADSLKENASAVVRLNQMDITISSQRNMNVKITRIVTVLDQKGLDKIGAIEYYSKTSSVKKMEASVLDGSGVEIKKIKRKDFKDQTAVSGSTLFSDDRIIYLDYTPVQYPFTIVYESETESTNTAMIPQWLPLSGYFVSVEKNVLNVNYPENLGFKKKEFNLSKFKVNTIVDTSTQLSYLATNLIAQKPEDYSPSFKTIFPKVMMSLEVFNLEGIDGTAKNWKEYGSWFSENILKGTEELSAETKEKIKLLVGNEKDPIAKAKIVYKYMQEKTRYISVQVGIGGFRPMLAKDVDRLGYGDCKALSNYTKALLNVVDVPSYYTELYGDADKRDIESDFFSVQGNHVVLCVPNKDKYIFLECTSQSNPFGYQANFTDDRNVVVIKPEGGEIIRTKDYQDKDNSQISKGNYSLSATGDLSGEITIVSEGSQYGRKTSVENMEPTEKETHYKRYWPNISNLKIDKTTFLNNKEKVSFAENVAISAINYANASGDKMMFVVNGYNQTSGNVKRIRNRKNPFEIDRGYHDTDEIAITLPIGFAIEFLPNNFELKGKFGEYKTELVKKDNNNLVYKRSLFLKKGLYTNIEYDEYRLFMEQVSRNDNAKIILTKNQL